MDFLVDGMNCVGFWMKYNFYNVNKYLVYKNEERVCYNSCYGNSIKFYLVWCKWFVGKMFCEKLVEKVCMVVKDLCKGK